MENAVIDHSTGEIVGSERQQYATRINARIGESVQSIIEAGKLLIDAKDKLPHGEFGKLFENKEVPFSRRTGQMLISVAQNNIITNAKHASYLPQSWYTLYELTKAPEDKLENWILGGQITPETQRKDVTKLLGYKHVSDDSYEWYTPEEYIEAAREVMGGIDLDPASCDSAQETVNASGYFTKENNGLEQPWKGNVWLNPPYCMPEVELFTQKAIREYQTGNIQQAIVLVNNATDTDWLQELMSQGACCFTDGRVHFFNQNGDQKLQTRQGQVFVYLGEHREQFNLIFSRFGLVMATL